MKIETTPLEGCYIIQPRIFKDERGYFYESFNKKTLQNNLDLEIEFVQDNESLSTYGVIRGLHAQAGKWAQAKLVSVSQGKVLDVVVDIRPQSKTFGQHFSIELSEENKTQLFVPKGFLHGFAVLSETAKFVYKCDEFYRKDSEIGVRYDDELLNIDWKVNPEDRIISEKDQALPDFKSLQL